MAKQPDISELEEWRDIPGWEGLYQASSWGRVKSLQRTAVAGRGRIRVVSERILKHYIQRGYRRVNLSHPERGMVAYRVHRLVCEVFHGPPNGDVEVAHNDGDSSNNHASNLRWATRLENMQDRVRHGVRLGEAVPSSVLTEADVRTMRRFIAKKISELARHYGVSRSTARDAVFRGSWKHID